MSKIVRYSIFWRQLIRKPLSYTFGKTLKHKIRLLRNNARPNGKPTIYAATHVFYDDIPAILYCLKKSAYLLLAVEGHENSIKTFDKCGLFLNGVIILDRNEKTSRENATSNMIKILQNNGDILIFPEGHWNLSPNLLVKPLSWGVIRLAEQTGANIVPIAIDLVNDEYCVLIGECFDYDRYSDKVEAVKSLRDKMATLVWELYEMKPMLCRAEISEKYWTDYIQNELARAPHDQESDECLSFQPKGEISLGEVLADMYGLEYKNIAVDYEQYQRIMRLVDRWNKPLKFLMQQEKLKGKL